jgi:uncharacterized surface protein with fasciclin (FAS1) repeats
MTKFKTKAKAVGTLLLSAMLMPACSDMDEYFEEPGWIAGSVYEKLADDGQYSIFLRGVDKAGYGPILNGKSILTVMAPTDQAMTTYLQEQYGGQTIDQLSVDEVKKLIGFHVLYYAFDKQKLTDFRPSEGDGAKEEEINLKNDRGLYYKFRTYSKDAPTKENDTAVVYHLERYMPVFSHMMFSTKNAGKGIDAKTNYEYFYPQTGWNGDGGFQVANANVTEYASIAKNGYIYKVDRVVKPLETIYKEMQQAGKYTKFLAFYDSFKDYQKDDALSLEYGNGQDLYQVVFNRNTAQALPPIASEWPVSDYRQVETLARKTFSIFAPTDQALANFFSDYWAEGGYASLDEVSPALIQTILRHSIYDESSARYNNANERVKSVVFPEEIELGLVHDNDGQTIQFDVNSVPQADRIICSNGVLYGCSVLTPPAQFNSVTGPAYQYKKFSTFQFMVDASGMQRTLSDDNSEFIMLYPDNDQLYDNLHLAVNDQNMLTNDQYPDGMSNSRASNISNTLVNAHVVPVYNGNSLLPASGIQVYPTLDASQRLYWYAKNGRITNSILHNRLLKHAANTTTEDDVYANVQLLDYRGDVNGWTNGHAYSYDKVLFEGNFDNVIPSTFILTMWNLRADTSTEFYGWVNLLQKANAMDINTQQLTITNGESCLMFVPTTQALERAIIDGRVPGVTATETVAGADDFFAHVTVTDEALLQDYLKRYFIPLSTAVITNYPYLGWGEDTSASGGLITKQQRETEVDGQVSIVTTNLNIYDDGTSLYVGIVDPATGTTPRRVKVSGTYDYLPFIYEDGAAHFIEDVL